MKKQIIVIIIFILIISKSYCFAQKDSLFINCNDTINIIAYRFITFNKLHHLDKAYYLNKKNTFYYGYFKHSNKYYFNKAVNDGKIPDCYVGSYYIIRNKKGKKCAEGDWYVSEDTFLSTGKEYYKNGKLKMMFSNDFEKTTWIYYTKKGEIMKNKGCTF